MIKRMTMLVRRDDRSLEDFRDHWLGKHADIVRQMPQLHRYVQNHLVKRIAGFGEDPGFKVHGIPELWFVDEAAKSIAFQSEAAKLLPVDEKNFIEGITIFAIEETVLREGRGAAKALLLVRKAGTNGDGAAADLRLSRRLDVELPGVRRFVMNRVVSTDHRPGVWHEPLPPDLILELRFDDNAAAEKALASETCRSIFTATPGGAKVAAFLVEERPIV